MSLLPSVGHGAVTDDMRHYQAFWSIWMWVIVSGVFAFALTVIGLLIAILRSCWRREMRELKS